MEYNLNIEIFAKVYQSACLVLIKLLKYEKELLSNL